MYDRYRNYQPPTTSRRKRQLRFNYRFVALCGVTVAIAGLGGFRAVYRPEKPLIAIPLPPYRPAPAVQAEPVASGAWGSLNTQVQKIITAHPDLDIAVTLVDLPTNTSANYGIQDRFAGASTTKVLTAALYLREIERGTRSLVEQINGQSAEDHLRLMVNQSNNESWEQLNTTLTHKKLEQYARSLGMNSFSARNNTLTARDEATLLTKLYQGSLLSSRHQKLLLSYMQHTNNESMIPAAAPEAAKLYHKYGMLEGNLHDAGIIEYQGRPLVLVVFTNGPSVTGAEYQKRTRLVQSISAKIFSVFYQQSNPELDIIAL